MSRTTLVLVLAATAVAGLGVAGQRVGVALSAALLLVLAAGATSSRRPVDRPALVLAGLLALQPTLRDAGWVVTACVVAALSGGAAAVALPGRWPALGVALGAPIRQLTGLRAVVAGARARVPQGPGRRRWPALARGAGLAILLVGVFGGLFAAADPAFADASGALLRLDGGVDGLGTRLVLATLACGTAGALVVAAEPRPLGPGREPLLSAGRTELVVALVALVALFASFVVVQRPILFGGDAHVRGTAGLGYGEHARHGFVLLLVVAALTLAVVGVAARTRDRTVRGLLGALCVLTLVVLWSAHLRIGLVTDAYGLTRVRYGGQAVLVWLAAVLVVVLVAGVRPGAAARGPRVVLLIGLLTVLGFSITNPDGRIAASVVARQAAGEPVDRAYVHGLSADALHRLWRIPRTRGGAALWTPIERRLERPDGVLGFNVGRWTAR